MIETLRIEKIIFEDSGYAFVLVDEQDHILNWMFFNDEGKEIGINNELD